MTTRAVVLLSGGLDSMLAIRILQEQGAEVEALNFQTLFTCCKNTAAQAARRLGVPLTVLEQRDDYIELVRKPRYGYGKGANPCIDCRIYMFQLARQFADQAGAEIVASGEVLGQRPKSQKRRDLAIIAQQSGLADRLLRPLSARLLPPTRAEREGRIDRRQLYDFQGRSRKGLIELARRLGIEQIPSPSSGCALTELSFAPKVHDLVQLDPLSRRWDFELLKTGRHIRLDARNKAVVGRRDEENQRLEQMFDAPDSRAGALLVPLGFAGASVMLVGPADDGSLDVAVGLVHRYSKLRPGQRATVRLLTPSEERLVEVQPHTAAEAAITL